MPWTLRDGPTSHHMTGELSACRRLVLPPAAVALLPNEDSWSELAKQFLRRESFLGHRAKHGRRQKRAGALQHEDSGDGEAREAQRRRSAETGAGDLWDGDDLQGASPMSSQEVWPHQSAVRPHETCHPTVLCLRHNACSSPRNKSCCSSPRHKSREGCGGIFASSTDALG